jgi:serine/threonine protein kinase/tetratricopeptide (TPR) repeat protein
MTPRSRLERIFTRALDGPAGDRRSFVVAACEGDPDLEARVLRLLSAHEQSEGPLDVSLPALAAPLFATDGNDANADGPATAHHDGLEPGTRIGPYEITRLLGRGGMGTVYLARRADGAFELEVALKVVHRGRDDLGSHERFLAERRILARLQHPHIARLLDGGVTPEGLPYLAMEHVVGTPITTYCDARRMDIEERLDIFLQVCDAVAHAHRHQVVHRDLKPSNILVMEDDTGAPQVRLLDFGIAKLLEPLPGDPALTRPGLLPLTPEYAVPELLRGDPITLAADVYVLGLILYELLAGRRAYALDGSPSAVELTRIVCTQDPHPPSAAVHRRVERIRASGETRGDASPDVIARMRATSARRLRRSLHGDLDVICLRALEKQPARRYASVDALAEDIRRHRAGRPIRARRPTAAYRGIRFIARHRAGTTAAAAALAAVAVVSAVALARFGGPPSARVGEHDLDIRSANASRLYQEGLRTLPEDPAAARRFFRAALAEDSTFAPAAYSALDVEWRLEMPRDTVLALRLRRLVDELPERERQLMQARWAESESDPALPELARRLVSTYPAEPEGYYLLGRALMAQGQLSSAQAPLRRAVELDPDGLDGVAPHCVACDAYASLVSTLVAMDSLAAAERVAREWIDRRPSGSLGAWFQLAGTLAYQGRSEEALAAMRRTSPRQQTTPYLPIYPAILAIREGAFEEADALLREQARVGAPDVQREALWFLAISFRYQGRLREALAAARLLRQLDPSPNGPLAEAQVLFEMGRGLEAAARFDSMAALSPAGESAAAPSARAQRRSFALARVAVARHAVGDTAGLLALADSIELLGARTLSAHSRRLHHHVRGLLLADRGDLEAAEAAFRRASAWPNDNYTRMNLELARVLLALGRSDEAIPLLETAFHGPLETARFYVTHTELHELLGRALEATGEPERAVPHYEWVIRAWRDADPVFEARRAEVRRRLAALGPGIHRDAAGRLAPFGRS